MVSWICQQKKTIITVYRKLLDWQKRRRSVILFMDSHIQTATPGWLEGWKSRYQSHDMQVSSISQLWRAKLYLDQSNNKESGRSKIRTVRSKNNITLIRVRAKLENKVARQRGSNIWSFGRNTIHHHKLSFETSCISFFESSQIRQPCYERHHLF